MFGHGPFGEYPFGEGNWPERAVVGSVPRRLLIADDQAEGLYRTVMTSIGAELESSRAELRALSLQRDPYRVSSPDESVVVAEVASAASVSGTDHQWWLAEFGPIVRLVLSAPAFDVQPGWSTRGNAPLEVIRTLHHLEPPEIWVAGTTPPSAPTDLLFYPPTLIRHLGADYGLDLDQNEPAHFQRRTIAGAHQWWSFKGSETGYQIRGAMAGWNLQIRGLWHIESADIWAALPGRLRTEIPAGSGELYTTVPPVVVRYDEIPADVISVDYGYLYEDDSIDGMSPVMASAESLGVLEVVASTPLTDDQAATYGVPFGHDVELDVPAPIQPFIGSLDSGSFGIRPLSDLDTIYWIDREISRAFPVLHVVIATIDPPPIGNYMLTYRPPESESCGWCYSHRVQVTATPTDELSTSGVELSKAHERLMEKLAFATPIHVELCHRYNVTVDIEPTEEVEVIVEVG